MNLLKSIFITCFSTWLFLLTIYSFTQLARGMEPLLSWLGLALTVFTPLVFFMSVFVIKTPRTTRHPFEYSLLSGLGLALTMAMSYRYDQAAGTIHVWAGITFIGWLVYLRWYSPLKGRNSASLATGSPLPEFQLENMDKHMVSSESFKARPHLLLFYRGNWCPFCTAQIDELAAAYQRLQALGVTVVLISPQSVEKNRRLAARFDVPMVFLRDRNGEAARKLGIDHSWGTPMGMQLLGYQSDTVLPTVILTDQNGVIIFADQTDNYRVRPEPSTFEVIYREALDKTGADASE